MDQLDKPVALSYDNGKVSPSNVLLIGYIILGISALLSFKKKNRSHPGFLTFNILGVAWLGFWFVRLIFT